MKARFKKENLPELFKIITEYVNRNGDEYILELCRKRTLNQNAYYWSVIIPLFMSATGYSKRTADEKLCRGFLYEKKEGRTHTRTTSDLSTIEFERFLEDCRLHLYHFHRIVAPMPDQPDHIDDAFLEELEKINLY